MNIIINKTKTKFNIIVGTGISINQNITPTYSTHKPFKSKIQQLKQQKLKLETATKLSNKDNIWQFRNINYKNFNHLWVNIPRNITVLLKQNGKIT